VLGPCWGLEGPQATCRWQVERREKEGILLPPSPTTPVPGDPVWPALFFLHLTGPPTRPVSVESLLCAWPSVVTGPGDKEQSLS
jgi:hypothetical protein